MGLRIACDGRAPFQDGDDAHAELVRRSFAESQLANTLIRVADGQEALDYLYRREGYSDLAKSPRPGIILLDLRMPKVDGLTVLKTITRSRDQVGMRDR